MKSIRVRESVSIIVVAAFCFLVLSTALLPTPAFAAEDSQKTVRVGYVNVKGYEEGGEGEYKTGFGYEYFQTISYYTDWKYEYVYGSFSELIAKLSAGEIDILGNVTATEARAQTMDFSTYPEGNETFYAFIKGDRTDLGDPKPETLRGKKVGVGRNSYQSQLMDEYFSSLGIDIQKVELDGTREVVAALEAGTIDAAVMTDATDYGYTPTLVIGFHDYYFAVSKTRPDLLEELDTAMAQIQSADPNYNTSVAQKYSFGSATVNYLTKQEKSWLETHNNVIRLGYLEDNLPYSATAENGSLTGIMSIVASMLEEKYHINVQTYPFSTVAQAREAMTNGKVDCIGPVYGDYYLTEQFGNIQSKSMVTTTPAILFKGEPSYDTIAVSEKSLFVGSVVKTLFPNANIVEYASTEEAMEAVAHGKAGCTIITSAELNLLQQYQAMKDLSYSEMLQNAELCLLANHGEGSLLTILNKAIYLSSTQAKGATFVTSTDSGKTLTWGDFIRENVGILLTIAVAVIAFLLAALAHIFVSRRRAIKAEARAKASDEKVIQAQNNMDELSHQVVTDTLTGLSNRLGFESDAALFSDSSHITIISIDVNGLKAVNDTMGHERGDELLQATGELISGVFDAFGKCYHISGDEYLVIMQQGGDMVEELINKLKDNCAQAGNHPFTVSLSVGFARGSDNPDLSFPELLHLADQQMYQDKVDHYRNQLYDRRKDFIPDSASRIATHLSEYVPGGYFAYEAEGNEDLLYVNNEILSIFECHTKEQFMAHVKGSFRGMVHPDDLDRVENEIANQIRNHMDLDYTEYRIVTVKGNVKTVHDFGRYVSRANNTGMFYVMITEAGR